MVEFNHAYYSPMDQGYYGDAPKEEARIEKPIVSMKEMGQSVTEGRQFGTFRESINVAIRAGTGVIELSTQMEGAEPGVGVESYGKDARQDLKEMTRANQVNIVSVHTPTQIGSMSGFAGERGFDDQTRKNQVEEVKKAIEFSGDVTDGGAIVVHTGEYQRPISEQWWAKDEEGNQIFKAYDEEGDKAVIPIVDDRTGQVLASVRKNQIVARAVWNKSETEYVDANGQQVKSGDYIDYDNNKLARVNRVPKYDSKNQTFMVEDKTWKDFEQEAKEMNFEFEEKNSRKPSGDEIRTPEEAFLAATTETREKIARGYAASYSAHLNDNFEAIKKLRKAKEFYNNLEGNVPEDEKWRLMREDPVVGGVVGHLVPSDSRMPSELIGKAIQSYENNIESSRDMVQGQLQDAREQEIMREHATSVDKYALKQSIKSYVEAGVFAMDTTDAKDLKKDIFIAPEMIFPEMGYGAHPEELIGLVKKSREAMSDYLVEYRNMSKSQAEEEAQNHIKATFDTQHVGMWRKYFLPKSGESKEETDQRFNGWYMDQVKRMEEEKIIGHIHVVDGFGRGHTHLAAGQGIMPVKTAVEYLKEKGYEGTMISEAFGENVFGQGRQLTATWSEFGSPVYGLGAGGGDKRWSDVGQAYFGKTYPPNFVFGAYSPSNDWTLWSEVPLE